MCAQTLVSTRREHTETKRAAEAAGRNNSCRSGTFGLSWFGSWTDPVQIRSGRVEQTGTYGGPEVSHLMKHSHYDASVMSFVLRVIAWKLEAETENEANCVLLKLV